MSKTKTVDPKGVVRSVTYERALMMVNYLRDRHGLKPIKTLPRGIPNDPCNCPIALALKPIGVTGVNAGEILMERTTLTGAEDVRFTYQSYGDETENACVRVSEDFVNEFDSSDDNERVETERLADLFRITNE